MFRYTTYVDRDCGPPSRPFYWSDFPVLYFPFPLYDLMYEDSEWLYYVRAMYLYLTRSTTASYSGEPSLRVCLSARLFVLPEFPARSEAQQTRTYALHSSPA